MSDGLRVIGAGLHRTGSLSVKVALERLGFGPCYHGIEALRRPEHGRLWLDAYESDGDVDWSQNSHAKMFRNAHERIQELPEAQQQSTMHTVMARVLWENPDTFGGRLLDKEHGLELFERHYERVRRTVPAERLLGYRVEQGWEPLCRFLGVDVPDEPFPHVNSGDDVFDNVRMAMEDGTHTEEPAWR